MAKAKDERKTSKAIIQKATSWSTMRSLFSFKHHHNLNPKPQPKQLLVQTQTQKQKQKLQGQMPEETVKKKCKKMKCSGSLCSNTKVMHRPETSNSPETLKKNRPNSTDNHHHHNNNASSSSSSSFSSHSSSNRSMKAPLRELNVNGGSSLALDPSSLKESSGGSGASFRGKPLRRFYGCYECRMVVDPVLGIIRDPVPRNTVCSCPDCGEIFTNSENLELHQAVRHAVSELGPEDTSKNIVEIIFQSSWLKKQAPICKIDRILKVRNTQSTISKFEEYRDAIKAKATKLPRKNPRCVADGNELLRFHCTTVSCHLGLRSATNLCNDSSPSCRVCAIIKTGFGDKGQGKNGILTTATSGRAHDSWDAQDSRVGSVEGERAMLVCRVIAGRVKKCGGGEGYNRNFGGDGVGEEYDSVAGDVGAYSNLDELYVFDPKAILPCFVVIYSL
ncbi:PREDICTED: uncharacterized protein LOC104817077 [Tarenaya hassleriana]|uniref:uncharacterized protein LOC104817077 n=1 Tax=Tarenaya hassleriana TaxID=28532 RepID=UPI00053C2A2F|nr:PREDICTED: uncharacterized protein LOC104817077 [Tarenaya hassleriana]